MAVTLLLAAALLAPEAPPTNAGTPAADHVNVAYEEMAQKRNEAAIARIHADPAVESDDPAALINLGTAHARLGQKDRALAFYRAAIASPVRYDLQLADGRWMDSRAAARQAAAALEKSSTIVLR